MDELIDVVNAEASKTAEEEQARQEAALEEWRKLEAARQKAITRRADRKIIFRAVAFAMFNGGLIAAVRADLVAPVLWGIGLMLGFAWFGFHAGAWFQFRARKEDKLYG